MWTSQPIPSKLLTGNTLVLYEVKLIKSKNHKGSHRELPPPSFLSQHGSNLYTALELQPTVSIEHLRSNLLPPWPQWV